MTLDDLKIGMVLIDRIGNERVVVVEGEYFTFKGGFNILRDYKEELTNELKSKETDNHIMKIEYGGKVIWERKEITLSDDDITVLKALKIMNDVSYANIFLARDKTDDLYAYVNKPIKRIEAWGNYGTLFAINPNLFQFIKWEDEEPYAIDELLKNA